MTVRYATGEDVHRGLRHRQPRGRTRDFRERFRRADLLLIDDIQFLAEKTKTREEFFHTFNSLYESGSPARHPSDRKPRDIDSLEARLQRRFACGLIVELEPPDFDARLAILRTRARVDALHRVPGERSPRSPATSTPASALSRAR